MVRQHFPAVPAKHDRLAALITERHAVPVPPIADTQDRIALEAVARYAKQLQEALGRIQPDLIGDDTEWHGWVVSAGEAHAAAKDALGKMKGRKPGRTDLNRHGIAWAVIAREVWKEAFGKYPPKSLTSDTSSFLAFLADLLLQTRAPYVDARSVYVAWAREAARNHS